MTVTFFFFLMYVRYLITVMMTMQSFQERVPGLPKEQAMAILVGAMEKLERESQEELAAGDLLREFKNYLPSNPKTLVGGISPNRVLLYLAAYDQVVPYYQGLALRQMLGAPEAYLLPLVHYSSLLAAPWITDSALEWVSRQWAVTP